MATLASQVGSTLANLVGLYFLARLVTPAEFGLVAKVTAAVGLVSVLGDFGLAVATIQSKEINENQLSSLFWFNLLAAFCVALTICLCSFPIAAFYEDERVIGMCLALALNIAIVGAGVQHAAILSRGMKFQAIGWLEFASVVFGLISAVTMARFGAGYWSLLVQLIARSSFKTIGYWLTSGFIPILILRGTGVRRMLKIGGNFTASKFVNYLSRNGDNILIGKFCGEADLGHYSKAYSLLLLPMQQMVAPMNRVAVPALSRLQSDPARYRAFFRNGVSIALAFQIPVAAFAAIAGREIILAFLGPDWQASIPIFYALIPNLLMATTAPATQWVYLSRGDTTRLLKNVLANSTLVLLSFAIGISFGAVGVAIAFSIASCIARIPSILYCFKPSPVGPGDFFPFMLTPLLLSVVAAVAAFWINTFIANPSPQLSLALKASIFFLVYASLLQMTPVGVSIRSRAYGLFSRSSLLASQ